MSDISDIIIRHLFGAATPEEEQRLQAWRAEDAEHEAVFRRLTSPQHLESEWRKRKAVNWQRAALQMKDRVGKKSRLSFLRIAAGIALLIVGGAIAHYLFLNDLNDPKDLKDSKELAQTKPSLKAGGMKAIITPTPALSTGKEGIEVSSPEELREVLAQLKTNEESPSPVGEGRGGVSLSLSVPRGGEFRIELEDGTEVWLNAQSKLVYPESFSATERRVQVEGEAYFRVAKNEAKPFFVETAGQVVRVVGTEFNVHSYAEDETVQTTLVSGQVAMQRQGDTSREMILTPGHQAIFDKAEGGIRIKSVDTEVVTSWKDGMFVFEDMTLADIMLTLSRWYDFEYDFRDKAAAETVFMGRIPRYSDFADVMEIIELSGGLRLTLTARHLTIESARN